MYLSKDIDEINLKDYQIMLKMLIVCICLLQYDFDIQRYQKKT